MRAYVGKSLTVCAVLFHGQKGVGEVAKRIDEFSERPFLCSLCIVQSQKGTIVQTQRNVSLTVR